VPLTIDVVIVAYNRFDLTESCLRHLARQTVEHRVILNDNGSTDETPERLAAEWPQVHRLRMETNQGFATACNRGVEAGDRDVIVLMNNDVDCRPDFLERLVAPMEADDRVGSVAALCLQPGEERIDSIGMTADPTLAAFQRQHGRPVAVAREPSPVLAGPAGAAAAYRRAAWETVGGLDEELFAYMEDFDLGLRLRAAGWKAASAPDAVGVHLGSATHGHRSARQRRYGGFSRGYMLRRYGMLRTRVAARVLATEASVVAGDLVISRDLLALKGRIAGWRAARGLPRRAAPPPDAIDAGIGFLASLQLRRGVYARGA
jgi:N-acetylglucosaminyl-diphospho-decaprenol L-rhamnosyltransferase